MEGKKEEEDEEEEKEEEKKVRAMYSFRELSKPNINNLNTTFFLLFFSDFVNFLVISLNVEERY